jgi:hypothetical protein
MTPAPYVHPDGTARTILDPAVSRLVEEHAKFTQTRYARLRDSARAALEKHRRKFGNDSTEMIRRTLKYAIVSMYGENGPASNVIEFPYKSDLSMNQRRVFATIKDLFNKRLHEPEYWCPSVFQLEGAHQDHLVGLLNPDRYTVRGTQATSKNVEARPSAGERRHKLVSKLYLTERDGEVIPRLKHIHFGLTDGTQRDKIDLVTDVRTDGTVSTPLHVEFYEPVSQGIAAEQEFVPDILLNHEINLRRKGAFGGQTKHYAQNGQDKQQVFIGGKIKDVAVPPFSQHANIRLLQLKPFLLGGTAFDQAVQFIAEHQKELQDIYQKLSRSE